MMWVSKIELRKLMLYFVLLFALFQLLSSVSSGYFMLMGARIGVACAHSVFWSIVSPLAVRVVDEKHRAWALSMIVTGTSIAMIFGLPLGRIIGLYIGWRMTFLCIGLFSFIVWAYLFRYLPKVPSGGGFSLHKLPVLLKNPLLMGLYFFTFLIATSYYTGYSYIEPFLKQIAGLGDRLITFTLMIFGGMGIVGRFSYSKFYVRAPKSFMNIVVLLIALCLLLLYPLSHWQFTVILLCACWGMAVTAFNVVLQAEIINHSSQNATAIAMSVFSGIFNLGIGCGTLIGGTTCDYFSISGVGYVGGVLAIFAFVFWYFRLCRLVHR